MQSQSRRGCLIGIIVLVVVLCAIIPLVISLGALGSLPLGEIFGQLGEALEETRVETVPVPGDAANFDPFAALPDVTVFAGEDVQLIGITARYVRSDGTMDLTADYTPAPAVDYEFVREVPRPENAPPIGAGSTTAGPWYEPITIEAYKPGQVRRVTRTGGGVNLSYQYTNQGMVRQVEDPTTNLSDPITTAPACTTTQLWEVALQHDAPSEAVAIITYMADGYTFSISGARINLDFDMDCNLVE